MWDREATDLLRSILELNSVASAKRFIRDLMTEDEIRMIVARWMVARLVTVTDQKPGISILQQGPGKTGSSISVLCPCQQLAS